MIYSSIFFLLGFSLYKQYNFTSKHTILVSILFFTYLLFSLIYLSSDYFTDEGINDAVIYHILYGLNGAGFSEYFLMIITSIFTFIFSFIFSFIYYKLINKNLHPQSNLTKKYITLFLILISFILHPTTNAISKFISVQVTPRLLQTQDIVWNEDDQEFLSYYKNEIPIETTEKHPNFIYIYAESLEDTYFDEKIFPNLMIGLKKIKEENIYFNNIHQISGSGWTIAGKVSSQCGVPLYTSSSGNSMQGMDTFYQGATCLGDFLDEEGYDLIYRGGATLQFAGKGKFYKTHSFSDIMGKEELLDVITDKDYMSSWGLYDDTLLDLTYDQFIQSSQKGKKFGLFALTLDTHHPKGHQGESCKDIKYKDGTNEMLNSVKCADFLITNFIQKVQSSKYADNTIIILSSDHLAMKNTATDLLNTGNRKNMLVIVDPRSKTPKKVTRDGAMIDVGSTLVQLLGYNNSIGLGRDLLNSKQTLYEKFEDINAQLAQWSSSIRKFWNFSKLSNIVTINTKEKSISFETQKYTYPVVIKINENSQLTPYFTDGNRKAYEYISDINISTPFIWIDTCKKTNKISGEYKNEFCLIYGKLGHKLFSQSLSNNDTFVSSNLNNINSNINNIKTYNKYIHKFKGMDAFLLLGKTNFNIVNSLPKQSSIYIPKKHRTSILSQYYKSIGLNPIEDFGDQKEFYLLKLNEESKLLSDTHNIEVLNTTRWYYGVRNYLIQQGYINRELKGLLCKITVK